MLNATDLSQKDITEISTFLNINQLPTIIQEPKYRETPETKLNLKFSISNSVIQGLYIKNKDTEKIYLFDISDKKIDLKNKSCLNVETFIKKGYLTHELTHYKQTLNKEVFEETDDYRTSEIEYEAFNNQLDYWYSNLNKENDNFQKCLKISSNTWFKEYVNSNLKEQEVFEIYKFIEN
jgi:hypothetical protein